MLEVKCGVQLFQVIPFLFADVVPVQKNLWLIGDAFLKEIFATLQDIRTEARAGERAMPYIMAHYNVDAFTTVQQPVCSLLTQVVNALNKAINESKPPHLPRFLLILLDKDFVENRGV